MIMVVLITVLVCVLCVLLVYLSSLKKQMEKPGLSKDEVSMVVQDSLLKFQNQLHLSLENTRREVEQSKDVINQHGLKTLETIQNMGQVLHRLSAQQEGAQELAQSLKYLLQSPKLRGNYGEEILEEMLSRILPKGIWEVQYRIDGREAVDAIVKFKDIVVPIDSKFPRDDYDRYLNSEDVAVKKQAWKAYEEALKRQINSIRDKYIKPDKGTTEFALMFIPSEAVYYETIAEKNELGQPCAIYEYAHKCGVIPVSPNTFYAFLQVILMGVRNVDILKNAKALQDSLKKVERDYELLYKKFTDVGDKLKKAVQSYDIGAGHIDRFKRSLDATLSLELPDQADDTEAVLPLAADESVPS